MEALLILIGLIVLAVPVSIIVLIIATSGLKRRVGQLEAELRALRDTRAPVRAPTMAAPVVPADTVTGPAPAPKPAEAPKEAAEVPEQATEVPPETAADPIAEAPKSPWPVPPPPAAPVAPPPPRAPSPLERAFAWLRINWVYAVSAVSLGLAGIFLVQYGIEQGLLPPVVRVTLAMLFGAGLLGAGEFIRRRWGDDEDSPTAFLPSTFSAAGIVVLYAAIIAARSLYGLIGQEMAFAGLVLVSLIAVVFGWFYGPFLAAAGLSGAAAAPFLVGGSSEAVDGLQGFYALIGATALAIDAMRRWGWVSVLGLTLAYLGGAAVFAAGGTFPPFAAMLLALGLAAVALPRLELWPSHPGRTVLELVLNKGPREEKPIPPTFIAAGGILATVVFTALAGTDQGAAGELLAICLLALLAVLLSIWTAGARGLADLALVPAAAFVTLVISQATDGGDLFREFTAFLLAETPETRPPMTVTLLVGLGTAMSLAMAWRSSRGPYAPLWAAAAAILAPGTAVLIEVFWYPRPVIGAYLWAGHAIALAGLMTIFAERFARADGEDRRRAAYAVLSALSLIALALFILLSKAALTVALAVLVATAAVLDRRFRLPEMHWFILAAIGTLGWRLILDPGLDDYLEFTPLWEVLLAFGSALAGLAVAMRALPEARRTTIAALESAIWAYGGVLVTVLLWRAIAAQMPFDEDRLSHWSTALFAMVWSVLALAQVYRLTTSRELRFVRIALGAIYAALATLAYLASLTILNPMLGWRESVFGLQPFDTLTVAYGLPALLFAGLAARATWLRWRRAAIGPAALFGTMWIFLEIRWFWRGPEIIAAGFTQPELYSYTVAMLIAGGLLLYQSIARQSVLMRRVALGVIALTALKVFLVDISGLTGLLRVFSFLALGLVLAGLAWLNRWADLQSRADEADGGDQTSPS